MDYRARLFLAAASLIAGMAISGCVPVPRRYQSALDHERSPDWDNTALNVLIEKYGPPDRIEPKRVVWERKGPWKRIAVWDEMDYLQISRDADNIEETIAYLVPESKRKAVENFNKRLKVSPGVAELSARSASEERNFLALNLADEVIQGIRTPEAAKDFYDLTIKLANAGKSSPYMQGLHFQPPRPAAAP